MQALLHHRYGPPESLAVGTLERPEPKATQVRVAVRSALVAIGDVHVIAGRPYLVRLSGFGGVPRPRHRVPGLTMSGVVDAVGSAVSDLAVGDEVFGEVQGAFAEYALASPARLAHKPADLSWHQAATVPWGFAPWLGVISKGNAQPGEEVLVVGASGGVGTWAVQLAASRGSRVTAVCSARNRELVLGLGAARAVDYHKEDPLQGKRAYDLVFDAVGDRPIADCVAALKPGGRYLCCSGPNHPWFGPMGRMLALALQRPFRAAHLHSVVALSPTRAPLTELAQWVTSGAVRPVVDRVYPLADLPRALSYVATRRARGHVLAQISGE